MKKKEQHIVIKSIILMLMLAILLPSAVKFTHVFENHKHEVCTDTSNTHFHEVEIDCEFYKFKVNNPFTLILNDYKIPLIKNYQDKITNKYLFVSSFKSFGISLRGPPTSSKSLS